MMESTAGTARERVPTVVLDDDPTGTQMATDVTVLLRWDAEAIASALTSEGSVYIQTNSRAIPEDEAAELARHLSEEINDAGRRIGREILVVLRGDSTLRGHVFTESDVFAGTEARVLFVPAFPQGGRTTIDSVHRVAIAGKSVPVGETEFAKDPVFGFSSSNLVEWVAEIGNRPAVPVPLSELRSQGPGAVSAALATAGPGEFVVPDVETDDDVELIHAGLMEALADEVPVVVRSAATLAAICAGRLSTSFLPRPLPMRGGDGLLVVCGSHTAASTQQLDRLRDHLGIREVVILTDEAFADPEAAGRKAAAEALHILDRTGTAVVTSERVRRAEDDTLAHGELVMRALMEAVRILADRVRTIVSKGGITSAEVARAGIGADRARVVGQIAAGISVWDHGDGAAGARQIVVPGNVGGPETLVDVVGALGRNDRIERTIA